MEPILAEVNTNFKTLSRFVYEQTYNPYLVILVDGLQTACKVISNAVRIASLANLLGVEGSVNASGDEVKKLDKLSNDIMMDCLKATHLCRVLISEEEDQPIIMSEDQYLQFHPPFSIAFDPLDGSSNIDCNVSTGTIFSVFPTINPPPGQEPTDVLRPGRDIILAGYCMYGSATEMVLSFQLPNTNERHVYKFSLSPSIGEFVVTSSDMKMPKVSKKIYSVNEGNSALWDTHVQSAINSFKYTSSSSSSSSSSSPGYSLRYVGSMVSDVHRTMMYGGIFLYPADRKSKQGKLRILYEAFPMAYLAEASGGVAYTMPYGDNDTCLVHHQLLLDIVPVGIHERTGLMIGCERDVDIILQAYNEGRK